MISKDKQIVQVVCDKDIVSLVDNLAEYSGMSRSQYFCYALKYYISLENDVFYKKAKKHIKPRSTFDV